MIVPAVVDTNILIDLLRGFAPSVEWYRNNTDVGITSISAIELIEGATNSRDQTRVVKFLSGFGRVTTLPVDFDVAENWLLQFRLSHSIDSYDCLIAATTFRLNLPIYTRNNKHFNLLVPDLIRTGY